MLAVFVQRHNNVRYNNFSTDEFLTSNGLIYNDSSVIIFNLLHGNVLYHFYHFNFSFCFHRHRFYNILM